MATWLPGEPRVASLLEAAYRVDLEEQPWSDNIFHAFSPSVSGVSEAVAYSFHYPLDGFFKIGVVSASTPALATWLRGERPPEEDWFIRRMFQGQTWVRSASELLQHDMGKLREHFTNVQFPFQDSWAVVGANIERKGYLLSATLSHPVAPLPPGLLRQWKRIAAHLSAAFCLRDSMARGLAPSEGILAPDGKLLHAEGSARSPDARDALRLAVRGIDAARSRFRHDPEASLHAWQAVVSGRWSLVEQHEHDGKRFLLARVNELQAPGDKALSTRERQVLGLVAQGASNKEIGYRLGIGEPSVAGYLRRGRLKVGLKNRADLLRWWQQQATPEE